MCLSTEKLVLSIYRLEFYTELESVDLLPIHNIVTHIVLNNLVTLDTTECILYHNSVSSFVVAMFKSYLVHLHRPIQFKYKVVQA